MTETNIIRIHRAATAAAGAALCLSVGAGLAWAQTFNTIPINGGNSFNTTWESFETSTTVADTGYTAYASWDEEYLYLGLTGSDVGGGDCSDITAAECDIFETGQSQSKYLVFYLDTDPAADTGTRMAKTYMGDDQSWTLPESMGADYLVEVRLDGTNDPNSQAYTGQSILYEWDGSWTEKLRATGPDMAMSEFQIFDNNGSAYLEMALLRSALRTNEAPGEPEGEGDRDPSQVQIVGWVTNTEDLSASSEDDRKSYAYFPKSAARGAWEDAELGTTSGSTTLSDSYGFILDDKQLPNASNGQANLNRPFTGDYDCPTIFETDPGDNKGTGLPFHTIPINGSNGFNSANEQFDTSTTAATGYAAYATWDRANLYLGMTGSDIGGGDCADPSAMNCAFFETGQAPTKWLVYYIDADPAGFDGTRQAFFPEELMETDFTADLPFYADYAIFVRTDGSSADASPYTGVTEVWRYDAGSWSSLGSCPVRVFDNNTSGFLEMGVDLSDLGSPDKIKILGFFLDADDDRAYATWPADAASGADDRGVVTGSARFENAWGFEMAPNVTPNAPGNKNRDFFVPIEDQVTPNSYFIDGQRQPFEQLPKEYLGRENSSSPGLYMTWDSSAVYLSMSENPLVGTSSDLYIAIDNDPVLGQDPREGDGSSSAPDVGPAGMDANEPTYPFAADRVIRIAGTSSADTSAQDPAPGELYTWSMSSWSEESAPSGSMVYRSETGPTEIKIPWSAFDVEPDGYFHMVIYLSDQGNGIDAQWPVANPQAQSPTLDTFLSFYRREDVEIFSNANVSLRTTSGGGLSRGLYSNIYLIVPNAGMNSGTWKLAGNTTVVNELYVGQSATLNFGSNADNFTGRNHLRFGRRLTAIGTLLSRGALVYAFDPQEGFPMEKEPRAGFATPSFESTIACDPMFDRLISYNTIAMAMCPTEGGSQ